MQEVAERKKSEQEKERLIVELQQALAEVKKLSGLLPICASCKRIRDDQGYWQQIEVTSASIPKRTSATGFARNAQKSCIPNSN